MYVSTCTLFGPTVWIVLCQCALVLMNHVLVMKKSHNILQSFVSVYEPFETSLTDVLLW